MDLLWIAAVLALALLARGLIALCEPGKEKR